MVADPAEWRAELERALGAGEKKLDLNDMGLGDAGAAEVVERLLRSKTAVTQLELNGNGLGDAGAAAVAELLRENSGESDVTALETLSLHYNLIGSDGIDSLADALKYNTSVRIVGLDGNKGTDDSCKDGSDAEAAVGIESLVAAISVNTTLVMVVVGDAQQRTVDAALGDMGTRELRRDQFLAGPTTKAAHKQD
jgi:Leucine Rich repeat